MSDEATSRGHAVSAGGDGDREPLVTFEQAEKVGPYKLAAWWADRSLWPMAGFPRPREAGRISDLEELAVMTALRKWLEQWTPTQIHRALLAGATVDQVAAAAGMTPDEVARCWREWDTGQRHLWETYPDMDKTTEHNQVAAILARQM